MLEKEQKSSNTSAHSPINTADERQFFDIVLLSPPSRMINHYRPPVGLMYVGGFLTHHGLRVKIIDVLLKEQIRNDRFFDTIEITLNRVRQQMLDEFAKVKTKIVGISCYTPEYPEVLDLAKAIRKIDPQVKLIAGGIHATLYPQELLEEGEIDFCVLGEGEVTTLELVRKLLSNPKGSFAQIHGLAYLDEHSKKTIITPPRALAENIDEISYPDYRLIDMDYYTNANPYAIRGCFLRSAYLLSSRGCPSNCTFCVAKNLRKYSGYGRVRSAESLITELKDLKSRFAIDAFYFIDDLFAIDKKNVQKFCQLLKDEGLNLLWGCSSKVSTLNEEVLKAMAYAGCVQIDFGVERGSDNALKHIKKGITVEMIKRIFGFCSKYGIRTFANMLVNVPGETEEDLQDILNLLDKIHPQVVSLNIFTPYPGTEIYNNGHYKFKKEEYPLLSKSQIMLIRRFPDKFKFSRHNIDLEKWIGENSRRYNKIIPNLKFYFSPIYWRTLIWSKAKMNYLAQLKLLIREFINQKF
ncbi:MAG TPA: hypothetical protein DCL35_02405 [Candidatus Omnitrophica bacterium]|nr:hypothetical protein [Candidatus Omnitrophota bacterium]